ncbi:MAG TPA: peptidylprolyl isomerase [Candidatus Saccharimonadia bacterium]|nr:peptidylprolyl isomerase [Candidatus Saccharimonadia bacterium]
MPRKDEDAVKDESKAMDPVRKKAEPKPEAAKPVKADKPDEPAPKVADVPEAEPAEAIDRPAKARDVRGLAIKVAAVVVGLAAVVVVVFGVLVYGYSSENQAVKSVAALVPYPVERVNGHFVTYHDYLFEVDANKRAYQNNAKLNNQPAVDFKSADGKKLVVQIKQHALDKLTGDSLTAQLASQKKVKVTDKDVNDSLNLLYQRSGGKDTVLKTLNQLYGWSFEDLKGVLRKLLVRQKLEEKVTSDPAADAAAKTKAQNVLKDIKGGADFGELAKKNSQASDASSGGDIGFFTKGQLPDELQKAAEALQPGQVSDPVKDQYGYEILKVVEKKDDGSIHALHILIKTVDFDEYFQGELKKAKTNKYIKV